METNSSKAQKLSIIAEVLYVLFLVIVISYIVARKQIDRLIPYQDAVIYYLVGLAILIAIPVIGLVLSLKVRKYEPESKSGKVMEIVYIVTMGLLFGGARIFG